MNVGAIRQKFNRYNRLVVDIGNTSDEFRLRVLKQQTKQVSDWLVKHIGRDFENICPKRFPND